MGGEGNEDAVLEQGYDSLSDDDEDRRGLEYACEGDSDVSDAFINIEDLVQRVEDKDFV